jgi:cytochrome c oxidase, subunit II
MGMGRRASVLIGGVFASVAALLMTAGAALADDLMGQPTPGGITLQPAASPLKVDAHHFHDLILMPIIAFISLLVLVLLIIVVVRFNRKSNPVPAKWSHNTAIELVWTIVPVLILLFISLFSFRLLFAYNDMPKPDLTVKATGSQWSWAYEYPDQGIGEYVSTMLTEAQVAEQGLPHSAYRMAAANPIVVPVGKTVRVQVTAADVIHAFALPAFGLKVDAVPGRLNETWFRADRTGTFYGQCSELCGIDHAFMPIEIRVVTQAEFEAWVAGKGGSMTYLADQAAAAQAAQAQASAQAAAAEAAAVDASATAETADPAAAEPAPAAAAPTNSQ